jgi:tripartite-type tricarboxylate transporter receptor subunit TctC
MQLARFASVTRIAAMLVLSSGIACAQDFPSRPMRIVTGTPGGGLDIGARAIGAELTAHWGQPVIVENRGFALAPPTVAKAVPDGYTMLFFGGPFWLAPYLVKNLSFDPVGDFAPITMAITSPNVLAVHPSVVANSVKEFIALAKANPGKLNYGASSPGSADHLAAELFKSMTGTELVYVPYKGAPQALTALTANEVQLYFVNSAAATPLLKAGRLKALGVASPQPSALVPGVPTISASGLPGFEASNDLGFFAPAKTPPSVITKLHLEIVRALNTQSVKQRLSNFEVIGSTPRELAASVKLKMARDGKLIKALGIHAE